MAGPSFEFINLMQSATDRSSSPPSYDGVQAKYLLFETPKSLTGSDKDEKYTRSNRSTVLSRFSLLGFVSIVNYMCKWSARRRDGQYTQSC